MSSPLHLAALGNAHFPDIDRTHTAPAVAWAPGRGLFVSYAGHQKVLWTHRPGDGLSGSWTAPQEFGQGYRSLSPALDAAGDKLV
ncbi:hypothetical protein [Embleya sp. NPDC059237]|uniref:hypothetical protein n=1 Tax=Embleya sp. NPDC059237 TaxID=3346784 RepID=UPI0036BECC53